jgi:hypothetical protein
MSSKRIQIAAKPKETVEVRDVVTGEILSQGEPWDKYLSNKEWSNCRDGLIIYKELKDDSL